MATGDDAEGATEQLRGLTIGEEATAAPPLADPAQQGAAPSDARQRCRGTVRWFNASKGFGFIQPEHAEEGDADFFVHQTSIRADGFRSLREGEPVEFDVEPGEDGRNKAVNVSGPGGAPPLGAPRRPQLPRGRLQGPAGGPPMGMMPGAQRQAAMLQQQYAAAGYYPSPAMGYPGGPPGAYPGGSASGSYPPAMAMYAQQRPPQGLPPMRPPLMPGAMFSQQMGPGRGRGGNGRYPGGPSGVADRRPPPGTPGISSGLQVVVHNLPWTCTWQQLKDAFVDAGVEGIERADVIIDSAGRSRGFGTVSFPSSEAANQAVQIMNNADIGGRAVTVRIDRFA